MTRSDFINLTYKKHFYIMALAPTTTTVHSRVCVFALTHNRDVKQ